MTSAQALHIALTTPNTARAVFYKRLATALSKVGK